MRRSRSSSPRSTASVSVRIATARCSTAAPIDAKQLTELQHELETLERRQASLEDSLLEVMERREELAAEQDRELAKIDAAAERTGAMLQRGATRRRTQIDQRPHQSPLAARRSDRRDRLPRW